MAMFEVGTHIDLRYLNEKVEPRPTQTSSGQHLYVPGTKIVFLNFISHLDILSVKTRTA